MVKAVCYHCGESCRKELIRLDEKDFCCEGCKTVYDLLKDHQMCTYYDFQSTPGVSPSSSVYEGKFDYLDHENIARQLTRFSDETHRHVVFQIPNIHCSSCIWLLENLHRLNPGILHSSVIFMRKELTVIFDPNQIKLSEIAILLVNVGYEPLINLENAEIKEKKVFKHDVLKIGVAGFGFGNIMMLSFPEYFSLGNFFEQHNLARFFGILNLILALPVFFYAASGFFISAWKSLRHRYLNIDAPIALAILTTFVRSVYEIVGQTGSGYLDSMSGIVFFMLIGRYFQNKTYDSLSFERDYKSYFPLGVSVKAEDGTVSGQPVADLKTGDIIVIRNNELIPADSVLLSTQTHIDYSFITGESEPVKKTYGELIYAGGRQLEGAVELKVSKPVSQSYLTQLWNNGKETKFKKNTKLVESINNWFTVVVLSLAFGSAIFWYFTDPSKSLNAFTAVLIVACPCGLLLTTTFANGTILRIFGKRKLYLKNANVIDKLAQMDVVIFDKTGTITKGLDVEFAGATLTEGQIQLVMSLAAQSSHPLSRAIHEKFSAGKELPVSDFKEKTGLGTCGHINGHEIRLGSAKYIYGKDSVQNNSFTSVFLAIDEDVLGYFKFETAYRDGLSTLVQELSETHSLKVLSGDNDAEKSKLKAIFGTETEMLFNQQPDMKQQLVKKLRAQGQQVMMIGDGLNDAVALKESDLGIAISDDTNTFSPACDAILDGSAFQQLSTFIKLAKMVKKVIVFTFVLSLIYNIAGLYFALQGTLSPVIAAILMPASSITIILLTTVSTSVLAGAIKTRTDESHFSH